MFNLTKKIVIIIAFRFSNNLTKIDYFLDLIEYLKSFIFKYAQRVNSLYKKKFFLLNNFLISRNFLENEKSLKCVFKIQLIMKNNYLKIFKIVRGLSSCNDIKIELINRLISRRKEIHAN